ncbi:Ras-related protein RabA5c-like protein [Tanacetum coccineum]
MLVTSIVVLNDCAILMHRPHFLYYHNVFFLLIPLRKTYAAHSETTVARMLVGNKCDLENIRAVSVEDGKNLAEKHGLFFMETSALDSTNVKTAFEMVIKEIYNNVSRKVLNSDSYKAELSVNRVTLSNNGEGGSKQDQSRFSCCSS